ncbi:MAG: PadR family transcriptional regulator [Candidatus Aminicenantes bacterium]|nr:PadR family transcriptional regulator [Candidatus Aminicenantes bacterium]MDH5385779.1 PadR family transcriptional regulator [Candidatus Aminicenantes bacterium]MDH5743705.1 PadR family transcriptional regulator [Candidatus Aminicenantes bacterium]
MKDLTLNETAVLLTILSLDENAYGVAIKEGVSKLLKKKVSYGTLYSYLDQLFRKRYVSKTVGDPTSERGGRRKIFYQVTKEGEKALKAAYQVQKSIWASLSDVTFDKV